MKVKMVNKKDEIKRLKEKVKSLKQEISYLNNLLSDASESDWDAEGLYTDARDGLWNGQKIDSDCKGDKKYAEFVANRYNLEIDEDGEVISS